MSKIQITTKYAEVKPSGFYVYLHRKASNNDIFYVGKGQGNRGWHKARGVFWKHKATKHGVIVDVIQDGMSEDDAFLLEMWMIAKLRHEGHALCNLTDGGDGTTGAVSHQRIKVFCSNGMEFPSCEHAAAWLIVCGNASASSSLISACINENRNSAYGYSWWKEWQMPREYVCPKKAAAAKKKRPVENSIGDWFDSLSSAAQWCRENGKPNARDGGIGACLSGRTNSAYGWVWQYAGPQP